MCPNGWSQRCEVLSRAPRIRPFWTYPGPWAVQALQKTSKSMAREPNKTQKAPNGDPETYRKSQNVAQVDDFIAERGPRMLWQRVAQERPHIYIYREREKYICNSLWARTR